MTNGDVLISVQNVSKKFCLSLKKGLWYGIKDIGLELLGRNSQRELRQQEFWAVNDVSFQLRRGECLGLIGRNGAGKSTLLKMLNGLIKPDKGRITMRGRVGALIELGAGFNPILTGLENIYVNAAVLGIPKQEVKKRLDSIIEFAEVADFINTPVQYYSSGMKVRLGFAVAAQMEPDVLLLDEVLAVGDLSFRARCFNAIGRISAKAAVIFVSHQLPEVARICNDILVFDNGKTVFKGKDVTGGIEYYYSKFDPQKPQISGSGRATVHQVKLSSESHQETDDELFVMSYLDDLSVDIVFSVDSDVGELSITLVFFDKQLRAIAHCHSDHSNFSVPLMPDLIGVKVRIPRLQLNLGVYSVSVLIFDKNREILSRNDFIKSFQVVGSYAGSSAFQLQGEWSSY